MARSSYRNKAENEFYQAAKAAGLDVCKRGWPDFWWVKDGALHCAEVKPSKRVSLKREQEAVAAALAGLGVHCFRWSPDDGFTRIHGDNEDE